MQNRRMTAHRFFFGYLYDHFTHTSLYTHWKDLQKLIRRFRTFTFVLRIISILLTVVQTGALVLLSTVLFLIVLPVLLALMLGILLTALLESRRSNRKMKHLLERKKIYVIFLSTERNAFLWQNAQSLAAEGHAVIAVSPYLIGTQGMRRRGFYCTVRHESENVFLIRRYYFFSLRKHVLNGLSTTYIY